MRMFTTFSNACNALYFCAFARVPPFNLFSAAAAMVIGVIVGIPGGRKRDAIESLIMKLGNGEGYGNGFISGSMNFRAIITILGPLIFGSLYSGARRWASPSY